MLTFWHSRLHCNDWRLTFNYVLNFFIMRLIIYPPDTMFSNRCFPASLQRAVVIGCFKRLSLVARPFPWPLRGLRGWPVPSLVRIER